MPLHGLVHDSPALTAILHVTRRGRKHARNLAQAEREIESASYVWNEIIGGSEGMANFWRRIGFKEEWIAEPYRKK